MRRRAVWRTLPELCAWFTAAEGPGGAPALSDGASRVSYRELGTQVLGVSRVVRDWGIGPGDRVVLHGRNSCDWVIVAYGVMCAGAVLVPVTPSAPDAEIAQYADTLAATLVLTADRDRIAALVTCPVRGTAELLSAAGDAGPGLDPVLVGPDDTAVMLGTAGTTGVPKSVPLRHGALLRCYTEVARRLAVRPDDRLLGVVPLAHSFGFGGVLLTGLLAGAEVRLIPRYRAVESGSLLAALDITVLCGPPTLLADLSAAVDGVPAAGVGVRLIVTGGADVPPGRLATWVHRLGDPEVVVGYGMTEATGTVAMTDRTPGALLEPTGVPGMSLLDGVDVRIGPAAYGSAAGAIDVRGYNIAGPTDEYGWFATGDLGFLDDAGRLYVAGRAGQAIVVSGYQVHPSEVERVLSAAGSVADVLVFGIPDDRTGQQVIACVTPGPHGRPDPAALIGWCRERLAAYKVPRQIIVVDTMPTTDAGKHSRATVAATLRAAGLL